MVIRVGVSLVGGHVTSCVAINGGCVTSYVVMGVCHFLCCDEGWV